MGAVKSKAVKRRSATKHKRGTEIIIGGVKVVIRPHPVKGNIPIKVLRDAVAATVAARIAARNALH